MPAEEHAIPITRRVEAAMVQSVCKRLAELGREATILNNNAVEALASDYGFEFDPERGDEGWFEEREGQIVLVMNLQPRLKPEEIEDPEPATT